MDVQIDNDDLVEVLREDESLMDDLAERLVVKMQDGIREMVREAFDYHHDHFRMSWMRMMEAEISDLRSSTREDACGHGQQMYDGIFHVIRQFLNGEGREGAKEALGVDHLPETIQELVAAAVDSKINSVWEGSGYTLDNRTIKARIGEPQPAFG